MDGFFIKNVNLLKKYNDIWNKVSNSFKKVHDYEPIYIKKFFFDNDKDFHSRKIPEPGSNYVCSSVILIDSVLKK